MTQRSLPVPVLALGFRPLASVATPAAGSEIRRPVRALTSERDAVVDGQRLHRQRNIAQIARPPIESAPCVQLRGCERSLRMRFSRAPSFVLQAHMQRVPLSPQPACNRSALSVLLDVCPGVRAARFFRQVISLASALPGSFQVFAVLLLGTLSQPPKDFGSREFRSRRRSVLPSCPLGCVSGSPLAPRFVDGDVARLARAAESAWCSRATEERLMRQRQRAGRARLQSARKLSTAPGSNMARFRAELALTGGDFRGRLVEYRSASQTGTLYGHRSTPQQSGVARPRSLCNQHRGFFASIIPVERQQALAEAQPAQQQGNNGNAA